tara:strand:- start:1335 stop:1577 length:243 start_codon:yes stop_codon:yes gene_type:complete
MKIETLNWNTGCEYTPQGQIVMAVKDESGDIFFNDTSRRIWGKLTRAVSFSRGAIMREYDSGNYEWINRNQLHELFPGVK